ncbi:MAG: type II toxin-antitoxin system PemK/MazF family toxin [Oscillospiraceae bacterium]|nr:type II toxin-antitoxin system PemK/MazF family toxin [Oscillospiraceae bacterium]
MNTPTPDALDVALDKLKATISKLSPKRQDIITKWIVRWNRYLTLEDTFKPEYIPRYKRGDIVYVDFGFNVGNEYGGVHYAAVLEHDNSKTGGNIMVIPLTSLELGKTPADVAKADLYLGSNIISWTPFDTVAKPAQIRAVSKMRIIRPLKKGDQWARLSPAHLDAIDNRIKQMIIKKPTEKIVIDKA